MAASIPVPGDAYSVELWFWNGLPSDARAMTGYIVSRGRDREPGAPGEHLGIGGTDAGGQALGRLIAYNGDTKGTLLAGATELEPKRWYHVAYVRQGLDIAVYLDGNATPEIAGTLEPGCSPDIAGLWMGGRSDALFGLEGRLCHAAVFGRALTPAEIASHYRAAMA